MRCSQKHSVFFYEGTVEVSRRCGALRLRICFQLLRGFAAFCTLTVGEGARKIRGGFIEVGGCHDLVTRLVDRFDKGLRTEKAHK